MPIRIFWFLLLLMVCSIPAAALAGVPEFTLVIKDHTFNPPQLAIPAKQKVKIFIDNQDDSPEEFDSQELNREKVIPAHRTGVVFIGPLEAGTYKFMGEFHSATAQGTVVAQ